MSVGQESFNRALMSAGLWFGIAYGLGMAVGAPVSLTNTAIDSAIMGTSALSSDLIHAYIGMVPTMLTSAGVSGGIYAGIQRMYRGDRNYLINVVGAGSNDVFVEYVARSMGPSYGPAPPASVSSAVQSS